MPKHTDPVTISEDLLTLTKVVHLFIGLYMSVSTLVASPHPPLTGIFDRRWDLVTTLDFEWSVITRARPFKWTMLLHTGSRLCAFGDVLVTLSSLDAVTTIDCKPWVVMDWLLGSTAPLLASVLVILRIIAIWERNKYVVAVSAMATMANLAFLIQCLISSKAVWNPAVDICAIINPLGRRNYIYAILAADVVLLALMFFGLLRWRPMGLRGGVFELLYHQGFLWMVVLAFAEVPPIVMFGLDIDDPWNITFTASGTFLATIGATRLYRGLLNYSSVCDLELSSESARKITDVVYMSCGEADGSVEDTVMNIAPEYGLDEVSKPRILTK
ncbi:hypothetical protein FA95DRAFT_1606272 [Auriscalpium vulgare]|uniref:Uncharacterized protein n=1 Tax=Auriscalpium vulgare TaxID=40419 RepID=A0ACB8RU92_9AGAM|nr:hypothetical protein FA95DRAFT_1606272 [Auriscalpium vulgare]